MEKLEQKVLKAPVHFFGNQFNFISLAIIHFDFTIIFKNVSRYKINV